jgi:outer membrane biosynthesis protein TonB
MRVHLGKPGEGIIVRVRQGTRRAACKRGLAGLAALGSIFVSGLVAGASVGPVATAAKQIAPADVVALRFPEDWMNSDETTATAQAEAPASPAGGFMLASAGDIRLDAGMLFTPRPMPLVAPMVVEPAPDPVAVAPAVKPEPKVEAKVETKPSSKPEPKSETKPEPKTATAPTRAIAAATPQQHTVVAAATPPQHKPAAKKKGELFNDAQLASIKTRLKLSDYQQQYWPPVENALRAIGHAVARNGNNTPPTTALGYANESSRLAAQIDPDSQEVQQLKSAAFPLIMSMNDDQKQQVRNIAHVMGLERVASSF